MDAGFGDRWHNDDHTEVVFVALDGYRTVSTRDKLTEEGGYLTFADLDMATGWEAIDRKQTNPAPFYVVWLVGEQSTAKAYPWPWQLAEISILRFQDQYPAVYPEGAVEDSSVMRGYVLFNLETAVGRLSGCAPGGAWQGTTRRNSRLLQRVVTQPRTARRVSWMA